MAWLVATTVAASVVSHVLDLHFALRREWKPVSSIACGCKNCFCTPVFEWEKEEPERFFYWYALSSNAEGVRRGAVGAEEEFQCS